MAIHKVMAIGLICVFISMISCDDDEPVMLDEHALGSDYYPVSVGRSWTFRCDSIIYKDRGVIIRDTTSSYLRETVVDSFKDTNGETVHRLDVDWSRDSLKDWTLIQSSFIRKNRKQLEKVEHGLPFIRMVFPVQKFRSWDGNERIHPKTTLNIQGELLEAFAQWRYRYEYLDQSRTVNGRNYNQVCEVIETNEENLIERRFSLAMYARGVGPIFREQWILDTQNTNTGLPFEQRAQRGMILRLYLIQNQ